MSETGEVRSQSTAPGRPGELQESEADRIARRAYERFQARGGEHGHDQEDWYAAEAEVRGSREAASDRIAGDVDARRLEEAARGVGARGGAGRRRSEG